MTTRNLCKKCNKNFKKYQDLVDHDDHHTPYWTGKKITLSGADQIRLMIKDWQGSWKSFIKHQEKLNHPHDLAKALQIRKFEKDNKIQFIVCGGEVISFRSLT